jgi:hypothetical protein
MGLLTKGILFIFALAMLGLGAWMITLPIFAYLFLSPILRSRRRSAPQRVSSNGDPARRRGLPVVKLLGVVLLLLGLIGFAEGGTFSPIAFGVPGLLLLAAPTFVSSSASSAKPVEDSILLRGRFVPFRWYAMAEVKVSTRDPAGALSGLGERILFVSGPAPGLFVVISVMALGRAGAEGAVFDRMRAAARALSPLGVYLLPLDAKEASEVSSLPPRTKPPEGDLSQYLTSADYGAFLVEAKNGAVEGYSLHGPSGKGASALTRPTGRPPSTVFLSEMLRAAFQRSGAPHPDEYVIFLSSMAATMGETLGQRITESAEGEHGQVLLVSSLGTPKVRLCRAQLRAISEVYE